MEICSCAQKEEAIELLHACNKPRPFKVLIRRLVQPIIVCLGKLNSATLVLRYIFQNLVIMKTRINKRRD